MGLLPRFSLTSLIISPIEQILWLAFALAWGTTRLFFTRSIAEQDTFKENTWGFGQLIPVILLALPILSIGESYYGKQTQCARIML